ncbi:MAG: hypothetical protein HYX79_04320 [Chloroflexi bacterium]|nr:hypothetical protein [Chloroflexota bacterium]
MRGLNAWLRLPLVIILALLATVIPANPALGLVGTITIAPTSGTTSTPVLITGSGFTPGSIYAINFDTTPIATGTIDSGGGLATFFAVPPSTAGTHNITVATTGPDTSNIVTFTVAPEVSLTNTSGRTGGPISISGRGFAAVSTVTITFAGVPIGSTTSDVSGSFAVNLTVPDTTGATHTVAATDASGNTASTTFKVVPTVTLNPSPAGVGAQVTIRGSGFASSSTVTISFDAVPVTTTTTDTSGLFSINFAVPETTSGSHSVTANDSTGNTASTTLSIVARLTITPSPAVIGEQATVNGAGFAASSTITFFMDGVAVTAASATTNTAGEFNTRFAIPAIPAGTHTLQARDATGNSATINFSVAQAIAIDPKTGPSGTTVQFSGKGFSAGRSIAVNLDNVRVATSPLNLISDASGSLTGSFIVPASSGGAHSVVVSDGSFSAVASFNVVANATLNPVRGAVGTAAAVSGASFASGGSIVVIYDASPVAAATADSSGTFSASFNVPPGPTGTHAVNVADGTRSLSFNFAVVASATVNPAKGYVGTAITIIGTGFVSGGSIDVRYDTAQVTTVTADKTGGFSIAFRVPPSRSGDHPITITDGTSTIISTFNIDSTPPPLPALLSPAHDTKADTLTTFQWSAVTSPNGVTYVLQIARDSNFSFPVIQKTGLTNAGYKLTDQEKLPSANRQQPYYWRVKAVDGAFNESPWTPAQSFFVGFVLPTWALYTILALSIIAAGVLGFWLGKKASWVNKEKSG